MSYPLAAAAILTVGVGIAHSWLGERFILVRLLRRDLPHLYGSDRFTKATLRFAWHLTTIAWFGLAAVMLMIGDRLGDPVQSSAPLAADPGGWEQSAGYAIAATFAASAVITAAATRFKHLAWPLFGAIAALVWIGV
jgi:hypothetical protein